MPVPQSVSFERFDSRLTGEQPGSNGGHVFSPHGQKAGTEAPSEVLLRPIPPSPNKGKDTVSQGEYSGYPLVATAAGQRVIIFRRDAKLSPVQITKELQDTVLAVSWRKDRGVVNSAPLDPKGLVGRSKTALQGALAAACEKEVIVFLPFKPARGSRSFSVNFPYQWSRAHRIPVGASAIAWSMTSCSLAACSGYDVNLWQIPCMPQTEQPLGLTEAREPEWAFSLTDPPPAASSSPPATPLSSAAPSHAKASCVAISPDSVVVACAFADVPQLHFRAVEPPRIDNMSPEELQTECELADERLKPFLDKVPPSMLGAAQKQSPAFGPGSPAAAPRFSSMGSPPQGLQGMQASFGGTSSSLKTAELAARDYRGGAVIELGGSVLSVQFARTHLFQKLPGSNVLFALESNGSVKVILCCCKQEFPKFVCKATVCAIVRLPCVGAEYTVTWGLLPEESGNSMIPGTVHGGAANASFRHKKSAPGPQAKKPSVSDWTRGFGHYNSGRSKKSVQVAPQTTETPDEDWLMCIGSDRTMLVYKIEMALRQGDVVLDPKCATLNFTVDLDPCGDVSWQECVMGTSANVSNVAGGLEAAAHLQGVSNNVQPGVVSLISTAMSKDGTRRWMSAWDVHLPTRKATRSAHYAAHSDPVVCVSGHATQPFVASCSATGEAILWNNEFSYAAPAALSHFAVLKGTFGNLAWSPALASADGVWQTGLLWALALDGMAVQAFCVRPFKWEEQGGLLESAYTLHLGVQEEQDDDMASPASQGRTPGSQSEPRHLRVVLESSKEETGEMDKQLVIAVIAGSMHVWRVVVCPDETGCPSVFQSKRLPAYQLPRPAIALATFDPLDHSWRCGTQTHIVVTGGERGVVDVSEIRDSVAHQDTFIVHEGADVRITEMTFMTASELIVLVVDSSGKARGMVMERMSRDNWRLEGVLPRTFSSGAKVSSFLAGDGSALLGVFDEDRVIIFGSVPWSWTDGTSQGAEPSAPAQPARSFAKRWAVIRDVTLEQGGFMAGEPSEAWACAPAVPDSCMTWCTDGSLVVGSGTRMAVLGAGIYDASSMNAEILAEGRRAWSQAQGTAPPQLLQHGLSALWTKVDSLRAGASVVYYHPTLIEHFVLAGQVGQAANHLATLYNAMSKRQESGSPVGVDCAYESPMRALRQPSTPAPSAAASPEVQVPGPIEPFRPKGIAARLEGVDLSGVRKIAMMRVPDETKTKAVSKLVAKEERLQVLLCDGAGAEWDEASQQLRGTPVWSEVLSAIAKVEQQRAEPELRWGEDPPAPERDDKAEEAQAAPGRMHDDEEMLTLSEAQGLLKLLEECLEHMSGEQAAPPPRPRSPLNGHHGHDYLDGGEGAGITLTGLSFDAVCLLLAYTRAFVELRSGAGATLDLCGKMFFLVTRARVEFSQTRARQRATQNGQNGHANGNASPVGFEGASTADDLSGVVSSTVLCLARHSEQQEALVQLLRTPGQATAMLELHPALWLERDDTLKELVEKVADEQLKQRMKPMDAALMYVLAGKVSKLSKLFSTSDEKAVGAFLLRDFSEDKNRVAACKNAFSLIGKHNHEAAIAFFVLGNNIREAVALVCQNLRRPLLAVLVVRLAQGKAEAMKLVRDTIIPRALEQQDRGLLHLCYWYLDEFAASYAALWSLSTAKGSVGLQAETKGRLGGLLSRLDDGDEGSNQEDAGELCLEDNIHPCVVSLLAIVNATPKMRTASRILKVPKAPLKMLHEVTAYGLLADGCAVLAEEVLQGEGVLEGECARVRPLAVCVCLARLAEMIRAEGAKHASTGENQVDLSRLQAELHKLVALLRLDLRHVRPLLVRFCLTRGFWRLAHALVTGYFGGAIDQRDRSLAEVAVHPLTSSMADSIAEIALQLDYLQVLPRAVLSRIERKGKFLQLILHSLTVDNTGNAGALSVLAACVMTTHFILIWSKKDFEGLVQLMNQNEGLADRDNAAALSWLMQACNPAQFSIGKHRRLGGSPRGVSEWEEGWQHQSSNDLGRLLSAADAGGLSRFASITSGVGGEGDEEESPSVSDLIEEQADGCLMWVLVAKFRERIRLALSGPIASDLGGSFRVRTASWDWTTAHVSHDHEHEEHAPAHAPDTSVSSPAAASSDDASSPPLSPGGTAKKVLSGFAHKMMGFGERLMEKSTRFSMSPLSPNRKPSTSSDRPRPTNLLVPHPSQPVLPREVGNPNSLLRMGSTGISQNFFTDEGLADAESWQKTAPEQLGKRLMSALRGWRMRMKDSLMLGVYAFILNDGDLVEVDECELASKRDLFENKDPKKALWEFYYCQDTFRDLVDDAIKAQDGSTSTAQVRTLAEAVEHYTRRNALLKAMRYHKVFHGTVTVHLLRGQNLKVKDDFLSVFGKESKPSTYAVLQYEGSVDPVLYGTLVPKHTSEVVKKDTSPLYNQTFSFEIVSPRPVLRIEIMQKNKNFIGEDESIGAADLDISRIQENQVASLDVAIEREGESVGEVKLRMIFRYEPKTVDEQLQAASRVCSHAPPSGSPAGTRTASSGSEQAAVSTHRKSSLTGFFMPS